MTTPFIHERLNYSSWEKKHAIPLINKLESYFELWFNDVYIIYGLLYVNTMIFRQLTHKLFTNLFRF